MDPSELCRLLSHVIDLGTEGWDVEDKEVPIVSSLAGLLLLRDIYLDIFKDGKKATNFALEYYNQCRSNIDMGMFPFFVIRGPDLIKYIATQIRTVLMGFSGEKKAAQIKEEDMESIIRKLNYFYNPPHAEGIETTIYIDCCVLQFFAEKIRAEEGNLIFHPIYMSNLRAVLGDNSHNSFFVKFDGEYHFVPFAHPELSYTNGAELPGNLVSAIIMYPWEADHLLKAEEMTARGIPVAKPLGRLFVDEFEFGLFQWVRGQTLSSKREPPAWEAFGRLVRLCHERGVAIDDAAGRNAIWTDNGIKLIDFEHTWLKREPISLSEKERSVALERVEEEDKTLFEAFMRGYKSG